MANYSTSEFRSGLKVMLDGDPCSIVENEFVKPGKGQAFNRVRFRNLKTGRVLERTFKSGDTVEAADVMEANMEYLYTDGEFWHFMKTDGSFEQVAVDEAAITEAKNWLKEQDLYQVVTWNGAAGGTKPATLSSGAVVRVPLCVNRGDVLKVDTRTGEYQNRVSR